MYTWRGTILIEAGLVLNGLVIALLLRQPSINRSKSNTEIDDTLVKNHHALNKASNGNKHQLTNKTEETLHSNQKDLNDASNEKKNQHLFSIAWWMRR